MSHTNILRLLAILGILALALSLCSCRTKRREQSTTQLERVETDSLRQISRMQTHETDYLRLYIQGLRQSEDSLSLETERLDTLGRVQERSKLLLRRRQRMETKTQREDSVIVVTSREDSLSWQRRRAKSLQTNLFAQEERKPLLDLDPLLWGGVVGIILFVLLEARLRRS